MDIFGTVAAAIQLGETIYDLGKRIRKKPKDTKAVEVIVADAKKAVTSLRQWEAQMPPEVTQACRELRGKLQEIIDDVEGLKKKNLFKKMFTSLKLYHPEFLQQFSKSLALFQFHIGAQNQLAIGDVNGKLDSLKEEMKKLTISSELLPEGITGLDGKVAEIQDEIQRLSEMMDGFKLLEETRREAVSSFEARERLLTWIFGGIIDATHSSVKRRRADSSGEWLLNHLAFKEWESASNSAMILYCKGQPGAGKTSVVIDHLETSKTQNMALGYVYFDYKYPHTVLEVLKALLKQYACRLEVEELPEELRKLYETCSLGGLSPNSEQLLRCLLAVSEKFSFRAIVLDALDECKKDDLADILKVVRQLSEHSIKVYLTSRPHLSTVSEFFDNQSVAAFSSVIEVLADPTDVKRHLEEKIHSKQRLRADIIETVVANAKGVFLLAEIQSDHLMKFQSPGNLKAALSKPTPTKFFDFYRIIIQTIETSDGDIPEMARKVLSWIFRARRTLKMRELQQAIAMTSETKDLSDDDLPESSAIIEVCGSLVHYDPVDDTIAFAHEQVEYFLKETYLTSLLTDVDLAQTCLTYQLFDVFDSGPCPNNETFAARVRYYPFSRYSSQYWGSHLKGEGERTPHLQKLLANLLASQNKVDAMIQISHQSAVDTIPEEAEQFLPGWDKGVASRDRGYTLFHFIAQFDLTYILEAFLSEDSEQLQSVFSELRRPKVDDITQPVGFTALHIAAHQGHLNTLKRLLEIGADSQRQAASGLQAIHLALTRRNKEAVELLFRKLLEVAVESGDREISALLLAKGARVNSEVGLLHRVISKGDHEMLQMLLGAGADVNSRAYLGATPFEYAFLTRDREMVRLFLKAKANPFLQPSAGGRLEIRPLVSAIARGDREMVNLFWEFIDDFVIQEEVGAMAFGAACETGQEDIVELLLTRISVQVKTKDGLTPLYYAVLYRNSAIVALLLDRDPNLQAQTVRGSVALDVAVFHGDQEITRMLLEAGADTERIALNGFRSLHLASAKGDEAIVRLLLEWNANTLAVDEEKKTALHIAAQLGHLRIVDLLLEKNRNAVGIKDARGFLPLHLAAFSGHSEIVSTLLANMGTTNIQPHEATVSDSEAQLESSKLPTLDITIDSKTDDGITALHLAAQEGHAEVVRILLEAGASASITTPEGETPLQLAVRNGMLQSKDVSPPVSETVSLLLPASVDSSDPGAVALHLATLFQRDISEEPAESRISEQDAASEDVSVQEQSDTTAAEDV